MRRPTIVLAFVLLAAACDQATQTQAPPRSPGAEEPGEAAGVAAPVKIGLLYTVSEIGGEFAQAALGSAGLATEDAEAAGRPIEVVSADYGGNPSRAGQLAENLASQGVAGIVVASDDPALAPALGGFDEVPVVHALLADDDVTTSGSAFRVAPSNRLQAEKLAEYLTEVRGYDEIAILHDATPFGVEGADDIEDALEDQGASVILREGFRVGGDIHTPLTHAGQLDAQALVLWSRENGEAGRITIEMHKADQGYQLVLSGSLATFDYGKNAASQVTPVAFRDGILSVGTWAGPWFDLDRMKGFYERFREVNNAEAPFQAVQIYDAIRLVAQAAHGSGAGTATGADPADVAETIEATTDFEGAGVPLTFSADDHEGVGMEDMAILAFTTDQGAAGGDFAPDISTGGGFFTIDTQTIELPSELTYLVEGLPG